MSNTFSRSLVPTLAALCLASPGVAKDKKPVDPNKKICRSETPTGSLMPRSICHTGAEWAQIDAANAASTQAIANDRARSGTSQ